MANSKRLLIIDCSQLCYNSFYTFNNLSYNEKKTGIIFGFLMQIFKLAKDFDSKTFAFCWDSAKSYRKDIYPSYKEKRHSVEYTEEEKQDRKFLFLQRNELRQNILPALGFKNNLIKTGLEADDLITWIVDKNNGSVVVSSDNDLLQLLNRCEIYNLKTKIRIYEPDFIEQYGIKVNQWIDVKAIMGCTSDEVEGIQGVGLKYAIAYLKNELPKGKTFDKIESKESKEIINRNKKLIKLPFQEDVDNMGVVDLEEKFLADDWTKVFNKYGFKYFLDKKQFIPIREVFELK